MKNIIKKTKSYSAYFIALYVMLQFVGSIDAQVSGTVYRDLPVNGTSANTYGIKDVNEIGVEGVTVTVYPGGVTTTTAADGTYIIGANNAVRVEFSNWPSYLKESPDGGGVNTSVQFVTAPMSDVNFGLHDPIDYAGEEADIAMTFQVNNSGAETDLFTVRVLRNNDIPGVTTAGVPASGASDNNGTQDQEPINGDKLSFVNETGSIWGVAYDRQSKDIYVSSFVRRHSALGPEGMGAIYKIDDSNNVSLFTKVSNTGSIPSNASRNLSDDSTEPNHDPIFDEVGRVGLGDLDISPDNKTLYTVNVNTNEFIEIEVSNPSNKNHIAIGNPFGGGCPDGDVKSWGIGQHDGNVYVSSTCTSNLTQGSYISKLVNGTFVPVHQVPLDMQGEHSQASNINHLPGNARWRTWTSDPTDIFDVNLTKEGNYIRFSLPSPILSDIEFDEDNGMILSFIDRTAMQSGYRNFPPDPNENQLFMCHAAGEVLKVCKVNGIYYNEGTPQCPQKPARTSPATNYDDYPEYFGGEEWNPYHGENVLGGMAYQQGSKRVILTAWDPIDRGYDGVGDNHHNSGIEWLHTIDGTRTSGVRMAGGALLRYPYGGKAGGIGDVEILNAPAPVEIGNLIWMDTNGNGIQDPDESGIAGVVVNLLEDGVVIASATTDAGGHYIFSNDPNGPTSASHIYNISELNPNTEYTIRIPDYSTQASIGTNLPTNTNKGEGNNKDINDSDGVVLGNDVEAKVFAHKISSIGSNNHSYDFGFEPLPDCDETPYIICDGGTTSFTITAEAGLTDIVWYNSAGAQVGSGNTLTVDSYTIGMEDGADSYYYEAIDTDGCSKDLCCPVYFETEVCTIPCSARETHYADCNDNGTAGITTDDYFSLTVTGIIGNGSGNYVVKVGGFLSPGTPSGTAVTIVGNGIGNPLLKADGFTTYLVRVEDANDSSCFVEFNTEEVEPCSYCPTLNCKDATIQKN